MISVEEALKHVMDNVQLLTPIEKPILDSLGLVIAEDIASTISIPPTNNSGMDGYAVRSEDILGAAPNNPRTLKIIGEVPAGQCQIKYSSQ